MPASAAGSLRRSRSAWCCSWAMASAATAGSVTMSRLLRWFSNELYGDQLPGDSCARPEERALVDHDIHRIQRPSVESDDIPEAQAGQFIQRKVRLAEDRSQLDRDIAEPADQAS